MKPTLIRQEDKSNRHHKDGDYYLTEHRTAEGRLMLSEGRSKDESVQGILNMLRDAPFKHRERHGTANAANTASVFNLFESLARA